MKEAIQDLCRFVNTYLSTSEMPNTLRSSLELIGEKRLFGLALDILTWLRLQYRFRKRPPLRLAPQWQSSQDLRILLAHKLFPAGLLEITPDGAVFDRRLSEQEKEEIIRIGFEEYKVVVEVSRAPARTFGDTGAARSLSPTIVGGEV